jgi:sec-independent protein translocase protein TatA
MFGISPGQLLIILVIVLLIFGGKRLRGLGGDVGTAIKGFKKPCPKTQRRTIKRTTKR